MLEVAPAGNSEVMAHAIEAVVLGGLLGIGRWLNRREGVKKDSAAHESRQSIRASLDTLTGTVEGLRTDVGDLREEVRETRAFVVGPDGQNGLRGDLRKAESRIDAIEDRERERPRHIGEYNPPRRA